MKGFDNESANLHRQLTREKQFELAIKLTRLALPVWHTFTAKNELTYIDTVVGMKHEVDKDLLSKTIRAVEEHLRIHKLEKIPDGHLTELNKQFDDPVVALQDGDWEVADEVKKLFCAVYNLLEALGNEMTAYGESTIYVSINQAADSITTAKIMTFDELNNLLAEFKNGLK